MPTPSVPEDEAASLQMEWGEWKTIPKVSTIIPFGYETREDDPQTLYPVLLELEALEKAKEYRREGHSLRNIATWLEGVTGRKISHMGLDKRIKSDNQRRNKAATLRFWASKYQEAIQKAYDWDQKHTGLPEEFYKELLNPQFDITERASGAYKA
jgi:hypothetical protein